MVLGQWREETSQVGHGKDIKTRRITMKKLYTTILIIAVALFISCNEQKAEDDIKKAFTKITDKAVDVVDAVDKVTPKPTNAGGDTPPPPAPTLTKPVLSSYRVRTGQVATFPKVEGHTYRLKDPTISGVSLEVSDKNTGRVTSTQAASGVVVVATLDDSSEESDPIEFVDVTLTKPVLSSNHVIVGQVATFPKVEGHTYRLKDPTISGVSLEVSDKNTGRVTSTQAASGVVVVATLDGNSIDSKPIQFSLLHVANKAVLQDEIREAIRAHGNNVDLNYIDTSSVTDMSSLFQNNATFNGDISKWDVSSVEDMEYMFSGATAFNQNLNSWTVSSVTSMDSMFRDATAFNQPLNKWNVSKVTSMYKMFQNATSFNQPLNNWTVSSVEDMEYMFNGATAFNRPLSNWNVSKVTDMRAMFAYATAFNQDISGWVEKSGREITGMFIGATAMQASHKPSWAE